MVIVIVFDHVTCRLKKTTRFRDLQPKRISFNGDVSRPCLPGQSASIDQGQTDPFSWADQQDHLNMWGGRELKLHTQVKTQVIFRNLTQVRAKLHVQNANSKTCSARRREPGHVQFAAS